MLINYRQSDAWFVLVTIFGIWCHLLWLSHSHIKRKSCNMEVRQVVRVSVSYYTFVLGGLENQVLTIFHHTYIHISAYHWSWYPIYSLWGARVNSLPRLVRFSWNSHVSLDSSSCQDILEVGMLEKVKKQKIMTPKWSCHLKYCWPCSNFSCLLSIGYWSGSILL